MVNLILLDNIKLFGVELIDFSEFSELLIRFFFNLGVVLTIVRGIYYPLTKRKDHLFTLLLISMVVFLLCMLLSSVKLQMGFAMGLFAVFSIIRYRTDAIPIKEMTYLFVVIGVSVINALSNKKISYLEIVFSNLVLIAIIYGLEKIWLLRHESSKLIMYERIELIKPDRRADLVADLESRTGIKINRVEVGKIDFLKDAAQLMIFYYEDENRISVFDRAGGNDQDGDDD